MKNKYKKARRLTADEIAAQSSKVVTLQFSTPEIDTVLAALRFWQTEHDIGDTAECQMIAEDHGDALTVAQIDELCDRINCPQPSVRPIVFVQGGIVQSIIYPFPDAVADTPGTALDYDLIDYDIFEGTPDEEIAEYFLGRDESTRNYIKKNLPYEYKKFAEAIRRSKLRKTSKSKRKK